jgi:hypothetical protein
MVDFFLSILTSNNLDQTKKMYLLMLYALHLASSQNRQKNSFKKYLS